MDKSDLKRWAEDDPYNSTGWRKRSQEIAQEALKQISRAEELEEWILRNREWMHIDTVESEKLEILLMQSMKDEL